MLHKQIKKYAIVFASTQLRIARLRKYSIDPKAYLGRCISIRILAQGLVAGFQKANLQYQSTKVTLPSTPAESNVMNFMKKKNILKNNSFSQECSMEPDLPAFCWT